MRISINVGVLVLIGSALLPACGGNKELPGGGTGGRSTIESTGGNTTVGSGGAAGATTKQATGGAGGTTVVRTGGTVLGGRGGSSAGGAGGLPTGGAGGSSVGGAGGSTLGQVEGGPCSVEGQQSDCATADRMSSCARCQGHWLVCQRGQWFAVHCDPMQPADPSPDAAIDAPDGSGEAVDVPQIPDGKPLDTTSIDTGPIDSIGSPIDGTDTLRGYLVFANELMAFEACGTTNLAWANLQGWEGGQELLPELGPYCVTTDAGPAPCPGTIYVELAGTIASGGKYGHMSKFSSQLTVGRYLVASKTGPADCPFLAPVYPN